MIYFYFCHFYPIIFLSYYIEKFLILERVFFHFHSVFLNKMQNPSLELGFCILFEIVGIVLFTTWIKWGFAIRAGYLFLVFLKCYCPLTSPT